MHGNIGQRIECQPGGHLIITYKTTNATLRRGGVEEEGLVGGIEKEQDGKCGM